MNENEIGSIIVATAVNLHKNLGFILNFGSAFMKDGIIRIVNGLSD